MIKEITQFVDILNEDTFRRNLQLKEGLYIIVDVTKENNGYNLNNEEKLLKLEDIVLVKQDNDLDNEYLKEKFLDLTLNSQVVGKGKNKSFNSSAGIFMFTASPFGIAFKKERFEKNEKTIKALKDYFKAARKYNKTQKHNDWTDSFQWFCENVMFNLIPQITWFNSLKKSNLVFVFLKEPSINDYKEVNNNYLKDKVFNKEEFNIKVEKENFGISDNLSGFNDKKRFLQHKTGFSNLNYRISGEDAILLYKFFKLQQNQQIPNPMPIFVDKEELDLNNDVVNIYQDEKVLSYSQIIRRLIGKHKKQLQNYYLIFFERNLKGSKINDIDFVPVFQYELKDEIIYIDSLSIGEKFNQLRFLNVFDILYDLINPIFNKQLIQKNKDGKDWVKFFDDLDIKPEYGLTDGIVNLLYKYRKSIYDYIYKSQHHSITCKMFDDMMKRSIIDDIQHDEEMQKLNIIRDKINLWFNFYNFFCENQNRINMANKTLDITERLKVISINDDEHILNDDDFAFAAGQLIWWILVRSRSSNRSLALLEPFLQKVDSIELKKAIARSFDNYKHEFVMYPEKYAFDKIMSEVMGYEPETHLNLKNILHMILAGFFAKSIFKKPDPNQEL